MFERRVQLTRETGYEGFEAKPEEIGRSAAEVRRVVGDRFTVGVATSTDVLDAQVALLDAEVEGARLQASLRIAEARLLRAAGNR